MQGVEVQMDRARHTPWECMMKLMVLHSNQHLHAVTPYLPRKNNEELEIMSTSYHVCSHRMHQHGDCL